MKIIVDYLDILFAHTERRSAKESLEISLASLAPMTGADQTDNDSQVSKERILTVNLAATYLLFFVACCDMCLG
jgi:hypothetical protein